MKFVKVLIEVGLPEPQEKFCGECVYQPGFDDIEAGLPFECKLFGVHLNEPKHEPGKCLGYRRCKKCIDATKNEKTKHR